MGVAERFFAPRIDANHNFAGIQPRLQCSEGELCLRLQVKTPQGKIRETTMASTPSELIQHAVHPRGPVCPIGVDGDCTKGGLR